ncbi:MAG: hypothetical protein ACXVZV_15780 [Terriglobales bacterium]
MQFAKDSFYVALRDRLATVNPERKVTVDGVERPAVLVAENEGSLIGVENAFVLTWGEARPVGNGTSLMKMTCAIDYTTSGADGTNGDRGRLLGTLDGELLASSQPPRVQKTNYTMIPPQSLGTVMFWTDLEFDEPKDHQDRISRTARATVYFYSEVRP